MSQSQPLDEISKSVKALEKKDYYIYGLRFPNYKGFRLNSELPFDFPITVLLGQNGTNKSSVLHALYGSPHGQTIADFWFETELDAIPETREGLKQSVVHKYKNEDGQFVECIKARAPRRGNPDYWEPVRHSQIYGFSTSGTRITPVTLRVVHLDFRGELPAFDKYFYFPDPKHLERRDLEARKRGTRVRQYRKQDYLRSRSKRLKKALIESGKELTGDELKFLSYILDKKYISGRVLKHSLFHGHEGWTIIFNTEQVDSYSDAFAGSGESAAALLVHNVLEAPDKSLILLDEPETSLHPRAQQKMLEFLSHQAVRKSLQIVITTHSRCFVEGLPQKAIRLFVRRSDGIEINTNSSADEAFHEIETLPPGKIIIVEDERAKHIVLEALSMFSTHASQEFRILVRDGGTSMIYRDIQAYANSGRTDIFVVLDGDHKPSETIPARNKLPQGRKELENLIKQLTRGNNKSGPSFSFFDESQMTTFLEFLKKFVKYLPSLTPEKLVWDDHAAQEILGREVPEKILTEEDYKERLRMIGSHKPGYDADTVFKVLLSKLLESNSVLKQELSRLIEEIREMGH